MTGTYTPCDFFSSVEFSLTIIDDHMILTGYNRALLAAAQDSDRDYSVSNSQRSEAVDLAAWNVLLCCFSILILSPFSPFLFSFNLIMISIESREYRFIIVLDQTI